MGSCKYHKAILQPQELLLEWHEYVDFIVLLTSIQCVYANTKEAFESNYQALKESFPEQVKLITYLDEAKYPKRQQFAKPWTSKYRHFGHIATSKGEQGHYSFKRYLLGNRHDLLDLKDRWEVMLKVWRNEFMAKLEMARTRLAHDLQAKRWDFLDPNLNKQIVPNAMKSLVKQLLLMKNELNDKPCTGSFEQINGIPCYHTLQAAKQHNTTITKEYFHRHWHFDRAIEDEIHGEAVELPPEPPEPEGPHILAPLVVVMRGRPRKDRTTRRDASSWEVTAAAEATASTPATQRPGRVGGETSRVGSPAHSRDSCAC